MDAELRTALKQRIDEAVRAATNANRDGLRHGLESTYVNSRCRCDKCKAASNKARLARARKARGQQP